MEKRKIIIWSGLALFCITTFGFVINKDAHSVINQKYSEKLDFKGFEKKTAFEFIYKVDTRFSKTITKEQIDAALSVEDVIPREEVKKVGSYLKIHLTTFVEDRLDWIQVSCEGALFNKEQIQMLQSMDYSSSFSITGKVKKLDTQTSTMIEDTLIYYMTVVPYKPAAYMEGSDALIHYIKTQSREAAAIVDEKIIRPGKISFMITKEGGIGRAKLTSTSGDIPLDIRMLEVVKNIPGKWDIARNERGENVDQELVLFFGLIGC